MTNRFLYIFVLTIIGFSVFFAACNNDEPITDAGASLEFSLDTLAFDTVFTSVGSTTKRFKIYNRNEQPIVISNIQLENTSGMFRINVDGTAGNTHSNIEIPAEDSIYVFVEVTVDPDNSNNPFVINDGISFETNGNMQRIVLEAWGQNANYLGSKGSIGVLRNNLQDVILDDPKPYVIYGILIIDSANLVLPAGCRVYVHGGIVNQGNSYTDGILLFTESAKLISNGTLDNPVIIRGDRLEPFYDDEPGQWAGVLISQNSTGNIVNHTTIRNSIVGIRVDSAADLTIKNSTIHNTNSSNILGIHSKIYAENCTFFSSNSGNNVQLEYGGDYDFNYCTIASFSSVSSISHGSPALRMTNVTCFDEFCNDFKEFALDAKFKNCIIYGSRADEIQVFDRTETAGLFNFSLENCLIKQDQSEPDNNIIFDNCTNCEINVDPFFVDIDDYNYQLDTLSPAENKAIPIQDLNSTPITLDKIENMRDATNPDIGAFEYQY
jgi:hypothetical protein